MADAPLDLDTTVGPITVRLPSTRTYMDENGVIRHAAPPMRVGVRWVGGDHAPVVQEQVGGGPLADELSAETPDGTYVIRPVRESGEIVDYQWERHS